MFNGNGGHFFSTHTAGWIFGTQKGKTHLKRRHVPSLTFMDFVWYNITDVIWPIGHGAHKMWARSRASSLVVRVWYSKIHYKLFYHSTCQKTKANFSIIWVHKLLTFIPINDVLCLCKWSKKHSMKREANLLKPQDHVVSIIKSISEGICRDKHLSEKNSTKCCELHTIFGR